MNPVQIVLVEDNLGDVFLVEMALKANGFPFELTHFNNGVAALRVLLMENSFIPDAILLDLNTPKCDGFEVLTKLKSTPSFSQVPIAILTSSQARSDKSRAAIHNVRFIQKPSQLDDFLTTVGQAVKEMLHK